MTRDIAAVPLALERARQRFERWRRTRTSRRVRIPAALWATAVTLARQHGLYATCRTLRLDYAVLKRRLQATGDGGTTPSSPTFVELALPSSSCACMIELESPQGGRMRVQVHGAALPDLVALTRVVWNGTA